ncbi:hypothetical protein PM082_012577 [Marasmius tenuissimus]|nr:hypothetical protein PM082_012577 [Marasmius tenuissimus]
MPEFREDHAHVLTTKHAFEVAQQETGVLVFDVVALRADRTNVEQLKSPTKTRARLGFVDKLEPGSKIQRGQKSNQTPLYPPSLEKEYWKSKPKPSSAELLEGLAIRGPDSISPTGRSMVVDFGGLVLEEQPFEVGLAIEFQTHVLAFLTKDLLFQPHWWKSIDKIEKPIHVVYDYPDFLHAMANWISEQHFLDGKSDVHGSKLAFMVFRECRVAHEAGVYTTSEVFAMAGVSPFLLAQEVFGNPSRVARLILCFCTFAHRAFQKDFKSLVISAMFDTVLAPTPDQQQRYTTFLKVYGQDKSYCTICESVLVDNYWETLKKLGGQPGMWSRNDPGIELFDPFEPQYIKDRLDASSVSEPNLGHLVFDDSLWELFGCVIPERLDPITRLFVDHKIIRTANPPPTFLDPTVYQDLQWKTIPKKKKTQITYFYHCGCQIWTLVENFPSNCTKSRQTIVVTKAKSNLMVSTQVDLPESLTLPATATTPIVTDEHIDGGDDDSDSEDEVHSAVAMGKPIKLKVGGARKEKLFSDIVGRKSSDVAIGPLEYCGNASQHTGPHGILSVAVCPGDPTLPEYVLSCEAKHQVRQKNKKAFALLGTAKRAMSNALRKKSNTAVTKILQRRTVYLSGISSSSGLATSHCLSSPPIPSSSHHSSPTLPPLSQPPSPSVPSSSIPPSPTISPLSLPSTSTFSEIPPLSPQWVQKRQCSEDQYMVTGYGSLIEGSTSTQESTQEEHPRQRTQLHSALPHND